MPIKTILVPLDGSEGTESVLRTAFGVSRNLAAHLDVLHVPRGLQERGAAAG